MYLLCFAAFQMFNFRCWIKIILIYNPFLVGEPKLENQSDINEGIREKKTLVKKKALLLLVFPGPLAGENPKNVEWQCQEFENSLKEMF